MSVDIESVISMSTEQVQNTTSEAKFNSPEGWFKFHRHWFSEFEGSDGLTLALYLYCVGHASTYPGVRIVYTIKGPIELLPGQFCTSEQRLADYFRCSRKAISSRLKTLVRARQIAIKQDRCGTVIYVMSFADYQGVLGKVAPQSSGRGTDAEPTKPTNKELELELKKNTKKKKSTSEKPKQKTLINYTADELSAMGLHPSPAAPAHLLRHKDELVCQDYSEGHEDFGVWMTDTALSNRRSRYGDDFTMKITLAMKRYFLNNPEMYLKRVDHAGVFDTFAEREQSRESSRSGGANAY